LRPHAFVFLSLDCSTDNINIEEFETIYIGMVNDRDQGGDSAFFGNMISFQLQDMQLKVPTLNDFTELGAAAGGTVTGTVGLVTGSTIKAVSIFGSVGGGNGVAGGVQVSREGGSGGWPAKKAPKGTPMDAVLRQKQQGTLLDLEANLDADLVAPAAVAAASSLKSGSGQPAGQPRAGAADKFKLRLWRRRRRLGPGTYPADKRVASVELETDSDSDDDDETKELKFDAKVAEFIKLERLRELEQDSLDRQAKFDAKVVEHLGLNPKNGEPFADRSHIPNLHGSFKENLRRTFDENNDGEVDCCDILRGIGVAWRSSWGLIDHYLVGFPVISAVCTLAAWVAIAVQLRGVEMLFDSLDEFALVLGESTANLGPTVQLLINASFIGVIVLNLAVVSNGLLKWCKRLDRFEARSGARDLRERKPRCVKRVLIKLEEIIEGEDTRTWRYIFFSGIEAVVLWIVLRAHGFVLGFIVTPLLWALMIVQMLLSIAMACIFMMLLAAFQSCDKVAIAQKKIEQTQAALAAVQESQEVAAEQAAAIQAQQESQARMLGQQMGSLDSAIGTSGFGSGVSDFLDTGADYSERLTELCTAIDGLNDGIPYIFAGALALVLLEAIIIVRHHIFFERGYYEKILVQRNTELKGVRHLSHEQFVEAGGPTRVQEKWHKAVDLLKQRKSERKSLVGTRL